MKSPLRWYGGKGAIKDKILPLMPPCKVYVEVFGGGASMLLARKPVGLEVYNDIHEGVYTFFRVLSDPEKFEKFHRIVQPVLFSHQFYLECRDTWETEQDEIMKAVKFFVAARQAFSGIFGGHWGCEVRSVSKNKNVMAWMNCIDKLPEVHSRLRRIQVQNLDWRRIFKTYDNDDVLFYADPPYVHGTRVDAKVYKHEMTDDDHKELVDTILSLKGMVVLSGYRNDIYERLENEGWKVYDFEVQTTAKNVKAGDKRSRRTESVWVKPHNNVKWDWSIF